MTPQKKVVGGRERRLPEQRIDPRWSRRELEEALDKIIGADGLVGLEDVAHEVRTGHAIAISYDDDDDACARCGEVESRGVSLTRTLSALVGIAEEGSKWAGLTFEPSGMEWRARFDVSRAQAWAEAEAVRLLHGSVGQRLNARTHIGLTECMWPEERVKLLRAQAEQAQREGDFELASRLIYGEIPSIERWTMLRVVAETGSRRVLVDFQGASWLAVPLDAVRLPTSEDNSVEPAAEDGA